MRKGLFALVFAGVPVAVAAQQDLISADDYAGVWPFTFEEGYVACHVGNAITVMDAESGRMYPLNGAAKSRANALALEDLDNIWRESTEIPGTKVSIGPMIEKGLSLCL